MKNRMARKLKPDRYLLLPVLIILLLAVVISPARAQVTTCPCTIWDASTTPALPTDPDPSAVELGVKFRSDNDGIITGIRFYKGPNNTGTHTGKLWSITGALLASATFTGETATGWQQVDQSLRRETGRRRISSGWPG